MSSVEEPLARLEGDEQRRRGVKRFLKKYSLYQHHQLTLPSYVAYYPAIHGKHPLYVNNFVFACPGYGNGVGVGSYPSTGVQQGYPAGTGVYPGAGLQPGYGIGTGAGTGLPAGLGLVVKPGKAGYGTGQGYPETGLQQGYSNGLGSRELPGQGKVKAGVYGAEAGSRIPSVGVQQPYGNGGYPSALADMTGVQTPYRTRTGLGAGLGVDPTMAKYGGAGTYGGQPIMPLAGGFNGGAKPGKYDSSQLPYGSQPVVPAGLGRDYSAGTNGAGLPSYTAQAPGYGVDPSATKYGGAGELPYRGQSMTPTGLEANGNGLGYPNGDSQPGGPIAGGYGQLGTGQSLSSYGGKDSKYGLNGFMRYGRRGACPSGKC
ncbi:glycine-rich extracellular protein 1 [Microcaecilia unicolor]|uniref:Fibroin heavy chain-like n=1 Tax=Microcaecilia unicolor TaxID=1415580 RepID=A0A6P7YPM4_9AMPH|nr:fibroin heavy chain-like [Microcaecilia unicolor]